MARRDRSKPRVIPEFFTGMLQLVRGLRVWATAPKLMLLGVIPPLIVATIVIAGLVTLGVSLETITNFVTPFAKDWDEPYRTAVRLIAAVAFFVISFVIVIYTFTTLTLIIGDSFYERIWRHVEGTFGDVPDEDTAGFWRNLGRGIASIFRMLIPTILIGVGLFVLGFVPLAGQVLVPVVGALVGGWFLALELTGFAFDARGKSWRERRQALRAMRPATVGFGVAVYLTFLIPGGAVIMMPAAVAGATLLGRRALGERTRLARSTEPRSDAGAVEH